MKNLLSAECRKKSDRTLRVSFEYNWCSCFRTDMSMSLWKFIMKHEGVDYRDAVAMVESYGDTIVPSYIPVKQSNIQMPDGFCSLYTDTTFGERARTYLTSRGYDIDLLDEMGFGFCDSGDFMGYVIIPFKVKGELKYYVGRNFLGHSPKYRNAKHQKEDLLFNHDALFTQEKVYLNEGIFDAMVFGEQGIASLGWCLNPKQEQALLKSTVKELIVVSDQGWYEKSLKKIFKFSQNFQIKVINLDQQNGKDANEVGLTKILQLEEQTQYLNSEIWLDAVLSQI